jgi:hypothetical protein
MKTSAMLAAAAAVTTLALTAAGTARAESPETTKDLRCVVTAAMLASDTKEPDDHAAIVATELYYVGRIEGREAGFDYDKRVAEEAERIKADGLMTEAQRCIGYLAGRTDEMKRIDAIIQQHAK